MSQVAEVVTGRTTAEIVAARDRATSDLVELRMDYAADIDVAAALAGQSRPVIFTCRASWEGGRFQGSEEERLRILGEAIRLGADYVDVEWRADRSHLPRTRPGQLVLSHHDFAGMPSDLSDRLDAMRALRPDVLKIAVTASSLRDVLTLKKATEADRALVAIAMGAAGQVSRLCPARFGSLWTYGGQAGPGQTAPGQASARDLVVRYRVRSQSDATVLYGVAGKPLAHSASPAMHNAALGFLGIDAVYVPFETDDIDELLALAEALGVRGLSVTAPLKPAAFRRATRVDPFAGETGSVNTLLSTPDGWEGRNYDIAGFLAPFARRAFALDGRRAVIVGSGGSARTAAVALRSAGARVAISARRADAAQALADELGVASAAFPPPAGWDLLVNTTPVGTWPAVDRAPVDGESVRCGLVYDLIYNPEETRLIELARQAGARTIGGLEMLVGQACHQFRWWTGQEPPEDVMAEAARAFIHEARESQ